MWFCISYSKILGVRGRHSDLPIIASITTATDIDTIFINLICGLQQKESFISCNQSGMEGNSCQIEKAHQRHQQLQKQFNHPTSIHFYVGFQRLAAESLQAWIYTKFHVWRKFKVCSFSPFFVIQAHTHTFSVNYHRHTLRSFNVHPNPCLQTSAFHELRSGTGKRAWSAHLPFEPMMRFERCPVWMPRTKRQCMKCHWFMCLGVGVWGWGEHFLYWGFGQWLWFEQG